MNFDEENLHQIIHTMERGEEKFEELREQRDELFEANKKLVQLVKKLEAALEEAEGGSIRYDDSEYSFEDGWMPTDIIHDQNLDLDRDDLELDEIDSQVDEVLKSMKDIQDLNKQKQK